MKLLLVLGLITQAFGRPEEISSQKIDPRLVTSLKASETVNIFVTFSQSTDEVLGAISDTRFDTRGELLDALHAALQELAAQVQVNVVALLTTYEFQSLWITNQVYVKGATLELVLNLASLPEVKTLTLEEIIELDAVIEGPILHGRQNPEGEWGVKMIQAQEALDLLQSATNSPAEVVVATIDTGCRSTHEALRDNWRQEYGWYDPYDFNAAPVDINGHGTHTTGTICGKGGIGVYPDAKWVACRGCATSSCSQIALLACAQFITCPTLANGSEPNCKMAPNLVSNSWGGSRGASWFDGAIAAFHTGGIIPLFSIGNSGPSCNTANSPGDRNVIGVGSTTSEDNLSSFSSVGPTTDGRLKPEISAPGSDVISAYHTADDAYRSLSGTSMACPHAAGLTAFLFAYNPNLVYVNVTIYMKTGTDTENLISNGKVCGDDVGDDVFPNYHYGHGRINAFKSLLGLIQASRP